MKFSYSFIFARCHFETSDVVEAKALLKAMFTWLRSNPEVLGSFFVCDIKRGYPNVNRESSKYYYFNGEEIVTFK